VRHSRIVILIGLFLSPAALAQAQPAEQACALREPQAPRDQGHGTVVGIENAAGARAEITRREAQRGGAIDPRYLDDLRVIVRQDNGRMDTFDVPTGTTAHVGGRVRLEGSYRSDAAACAYVPHMAIPDDMPGV
jgi:hypothetical protein